jgi:amino acid transporter
VLAASELDKRSKLLGHRSKKYDTPAGLFIIMGIISSLLLILNFGLSENANEVFWTILAFSFVIFLLPYLFMFPAAVKLRKTDPETVRSYKVPGGIGGLTFCVVLCEICVAAAIYFLFKDAGGGFALWTLIIGTLLTTAAGFMLYKSGRKD